MPSMSTSKPAFPTSQLHVLKTHAGPVNALCYSSSAGTYLLTGSSDRSIHLSRAVPSSAAARAGVTREPIQRYNEHAYGVLDLAVSADNARFASVGGDKKVFLWDVERGTTLRRWSGHDGRVEAVEFGGVEDSVVISGSSDTTVKIWDARSNAQKPIQTLPEASDTVSSLSVHAPTATIVAGSYDGRVRAYDLRMGRMSVDILCVEKGAAVTSVRCSADGQAVLASCLDGMIRLLDRTDGSVLRGFGGRGAVVGGKVQAYRNESLRIRSAFAKGDAVVFSGGEPPAPSDGDQAIAPAKDQEARVYAWDVLNGQMIASVGMGEGVKVASCVAWNEAGNAWAAGCSDGSVHVLGA